MSSLWISKLIPCLFREESQPIPASESIGSFLSVTEDELREPIPISNTFFSCIEEKPDNKN